MEIVKHMGKKAKTVKIFDTTLRDGEQTPGVRFSYKNKIEIARSLDELGVEVIEAGFPASSVGEARNVSGVSAVVEATVAGLARCIPADIDICLKALEHAKKPRVHLFMATSQLHLCKKLKLDREEAVLRISESIEHAKRHISDIQFSPEDATRTDLGFLLHVIREAVISGANTINIADTVGYTTPTEFYNLIKSVDKLRREINFRISVHCHNDLGLAVANSLSAIQAGADQVETTINGIGERAGNCSMEELVLALSVRKDIFAAATTVNLKNVCSVSRLVEKLSGVTLASNKAIVGKNAFAHESGIHQHGMMADRNTYEIIDPESIGWGKTRLPFGKLSGSNGLKSFLEERGVHLSTIKLLKVYKAASKIIDSTGFVKSEILIRIAKER